VSGTVVRAARPRRLLSWAEQVEVRAAERRLESAHTIVDCRQRRGEPMWVECSCGETIPATTSRLLEVAYADHRRAAGLRAPTVAAAMGFHRAYS
jgi:hypothetical protein